MPAQAISVLDDIVQLNATFDLVVTGVGTNFLDESQGGFTVSSDFGDVSLTEVNALTGTLAVLTITTGTESNAFTISYGNTPVTVDVQLAVLPIVERIRQNLVASLQQIGTFGGYFTNPIVQPLYAANQTADSLIVLTMGTANLVQPPVQTIWKKQIFFGVGYALPPESQPTLPLDRQLSFLYADIFKAVYVDRQRNGLALDTVLQDESYESIPEESQFRVVVPIEVSYRTSESDPTVLAG